MKRVLQMRKDREAFHWFLDHVASAVVGTTSTEQVKYVKLPREWLSRSLEAFCLLCLENFFDMVKSQALDSRISTSPLWTKDGRGKRKNQGWEQDGIRRYNVLLQLVKENREEYSEEDEIYLRAKREEKEKSQMSKLKRKREALENRERNLEAADDDFSSDSD